MDFLKSLLVFWLMALPLSKILASEHRPNGVIEIEAACVCQKGLSRSGSECAIFCADKKVEITTLYGMVNVKSKLALRSDLRSGHSLFGNLHAWCTKEINDGRIAPTCHLEVRDRSANESTYYELNPLLNGSNEFKAYVVALENGKLYDIRLVERTSDNSSSFFEIKLD